MAKQSIIQREKRREKTVARFASKRAAIRKILASPTESEEAKEEARINLHKPPRNASPCRLRNRCRITGRPHGFYRKFGLGRTKLREAAMRGDIPGLKKASW